MLIVLWGIGNEQLLKAVHEAVTEIGHTPVVIDQREVLCTDVQLICAAEVAGYVRTPTHSINLCDITAAYIRPYDARRLPAIERAGPRSAAWRHALAVDEAISAWSELTPALVVNRLSAMMSNGSKPYQLELIRRHGFSVPDTLLTTDAAAVEEFWARHGEIIYKSTSGTRSIVARLRPEQRADFVRLRHCPVQFQQCINGRDHRAHVVGDEVYACEVISDATDYRYPVGASVELRACRLPHEIEDRCRTLAVALRLPLAGIDLRLTPAGEWYCFEVNPSPAFTYFEAHTDLPIGAAVARLLAAGAHAAQSWPALPAAPTHAAQVGV